MPGPEESYVDGEYLADAGDWAGQSRHSDMDIVAASLLVSEPSSAMQNAVSAFLDGYWVRRGVSKRFDLTAYATALDTLPPSDKGYAATALALYSVLCSTVSNLNNAQQTSIRRHLLIARGKLLARNLFPHVLVSLNQLVGPGQSLPIVDVASYRGYRCDDGTETYLGHRNDRRRQRCSSHR